MSRLSTLPRGLRDRIQPTHRGEGAGRVDSTVRRWLRHRIPRGDAGMTTAEYAVGTLAACAFATVLYKVVTSGTVLHALSRIVTTALDLRR